MPLECSPVVPLGQLDLCCSEHGSWTRSICVIGELVESASPRPHRRLPALDLHFNNIPRGCFCSLKFECWVRKSEGRWSSLGLRSFLPLLLLCPIELGLARVSYPSLGFHEKHCERNQTLPPWPLLHPHGPSHEQFCLQKHSQSLCPSCPGVMLVSCCCHLVGGLTGQMASPVLLPPNDQFPMLKLLGLRHWSSFCFMARPVSHKSPHPSLLTRAARSSKSMLTSLLFLAYPSVVPGNAAPWV